MQIKYNFQKRPRWVGPASLGVGLLILALAALPRFGRTSPVPGLSLLLSNDNSTLFLTITNAVTNEYYTIYSRVTLASNEYWIGSMIGATGQAVFSTNIGPAFSGFFKAESGNDRDGDGIEDFKDANRENTNVGVLTITIQSPANGSTVY